MVGPIVDACVKPTIKHPRIVSVDQPVHWAAFLIHHGLTGLAMHHAGDLRRAHASHIDIQIGAACDGADDAFHRGFDPVDGQFQTSREIIARTDRHNAERDATAADGVGPQGDHAVAAYDHQVVV